MVQLSSTRCSCIAIVWVILVSFAAITLCIASQREVVYFVIDSVRKLLDTPSFASWSWLICNETCFSTPTSPLYQVKLFIAVNNETKEHTDCLTPCSRALLEKLIITLPDNEFPVFYRTQRFITVFTRARHWSLSWVRWIQSTTSHTISPKSIIIWSSHPRLGLPSGLFPSRRKHTIRQCVVKVCLWSRFPTSGVHVDGNM
jgi:hypothetical protein